VTAGGKSPAGAAIALDDPITKFVPDSNMFSTGPVSLRNMLNMQSGFASYTSPPANAPDPFDTTKPVKPRELLRYVLSMLHANPSPGGAGAGYAYSNTNYFLLANTIEFFQQKTGDYDYRTFVRARIFQKAGMGNTGFIEDSFPNFAPPPYDLSVASFAAPSWPKGAGEIASSANDMLRWHAALMSDALVSANARKTLMAPVGSAGYAMGWSVSQSGPYTWYTHNGDIPGYVTQDGILRNPATGDWVSVVILANNDNVPGEAFAALCLARLAMDSSPTKAGLSPGTKTTCNIPAGQSKILPGGKPLPLLPLWHPTPPAPGARPR
jgi:CubicO group peptidase (beta-lactamase class C family)